MANLFIEIYFRSFIACNFYTNVSGVPKPFGIPYLNSEIPKIQASELSLLHLEILQISSLDVGLCFNDRLLLYLTIAPKLSKIT